MMPVRKPILRFTRKVKPVLKKIILKLGLGKLFVKLGLMNNLK